MFWLNCNNMSVIHVCLADRENVYRFIHTQSRSTPCTSKCYWLWQRRTQRLSISKRSSNELHSEMTVQGKTEKLMKYNIHQILSLSLSLALSSQCWASSASSNIPHSHSATVSSLPCSVPTPPHQPPHSHYNGSGCVCRPTSSAPCSSPQTFAQTHTVSCESISFLYSPTTASLHGQSGEFSHALKHELSIFIWSTIDTANSRLSCLSVTCHA